MKQKRCFGKQPQLTAMLDGIEQTARETIDTVHRIKALMQDYKHRIRREFPKMYSQDLLNNLFRHPYTKIEFVMRDLQVSRPTASNYLDRLCQNGFLEKHRRGVSNYYMNKPLIEIFTNTP